MEGTQPLASLRAGPPAPVCAARPRFRGPEPRLEPAPLGLDLLPLGVSCPSSRVRLTNFLRGDIL